jgi:non-specific serine/threonine protein kinase
MDAPDASEIEPAVAKRIEQAFARGSGAGMLHLGAAEIATSLPPSVAWFREIGRRFVTALCALPDVEELKARATIPAPEAELLELLASAPPFLGSERLTLERAVGLWEQVHVAFREEMGRHRGTVQEWLGARSAVWHRVGRVVLHLAENKRDPAAPFAFLATYTARLSKQGTVQHVPLGRAVEESAGKKDRSALLALLEPLQRASGQSALVKALVDSGDVFHPLPWSARDAHAFLKEVPALEAAGVVVRIPDWWSARRPPRATVSVTVGGRRPGGLGTDALLDFDVQVTLDGEVLRPEDWAEVEKGMSGLALIRGRWVEIDRDRLESTLARWKTAQKAAKGGIPFHKAMRLLTGAEAGTEGPTGDAAWTRVEAGAWLGKTLEGLRNPDSAARANPGRDLHAVLRPYQEVGVRWLWLLHELGLGGCLADDMGLGKTIQVIAVLLLRKKHGAAGRALLVVPASLLGNWQSELARFAPSIQVRVAHPSAPDALRGGEKGAAHDVVLTTYGTVARQAWIREEPWGAAILDEAQAIKNPSAKQTRAVKDLQSRWRLVLTGTPVENRLADLWSILDFACPGLLGSAKEFGAFTRRLEEGAHADFAPLRNLVRPYVLRRLKTDRAVISDLPDKVEVVAYCSLTKPQAVLYQRVIDDLARELEVADGMRRRGIVLAALLRMKQICNHPAHGLGGEDWAESASGKLARLREIAEPIAARQEKVLVFTQFREATAPLEGFLSGVFGQSGLVLHGETSIPKRRKLVDSFQSDDGPPFFVLSLKAGGTGLNLTAASHVVHFDRWWNPAVEAQATDRAFRIGQKKNVMVHKLVCKGTVEERIDRMIEAKKSLQEEALGGDGSAVLTELSNDEILRMVALDLKGAMGDSSDA